MQTKPKRWSLALVVALVFLSIALLTSALENQPSKGSVAVVNGAVITQEDFDREMGHARQQFLKMGKPLIDSQIQKIKKEVLENLIGFELLFQESQKKAIKVDEGTVNEQIMEIKKQFSTEAELKNALIKLNFTEATIKADIKRRLSIQQFIDTYIAKKATVSDEEIKDFYEIHPGLFKQPEQVRASHILIKVDSQANEAQQAVAHKKIEKIQNKLKKGKDFAALAKEFSQCPSSAKNGDLGYFGRGKMAKPFEEAAFSLKPGEVSDIVETRFGYHLIKVIDKKPETTMAFDAIKERLGKYLKQKKIQKDIKLYVLKLKEEAKVERLLTERP